MKTPTKTVEQIHASCGNANCTCIICTCGPACPGNGCTCGCNAK